MEQTELCFPQMANASCRRAKRSPAEAVTIHVALSVVTTLTVTLNLLVIISIAHFRQLHSPTNTLLLSLAVSDFLVGLLMFFQMVLISGCWFLGDVLCVLYQYLAYTITAASISTLVLISVDRYVAVFFPLQYGIRVTQWRVQVCVCVCWLCSCLFQCVILKDDLRHPGRHHSCYGQCVIAISRVLGLLDMALNLLAPVAVIVVLYVRVFVVAAAQARAMRSLVTAAGRSELKAARTLGVVVAVFLLCMCPYFCVAVTGRDHLLDASTATFVIYLIYFNSCLNPVIYACCYPWFRKSIRLIVTLAVLLPESRHTNIL